MKIQKILIYSSIILIIIFIMMYTYPWILSAGGIGNIRRYNFIVPREFIVKQIDSLILNDDMVGIPPKTIYNLDGTGYEFDSKFIYVINDKRDTVVYRYTYFNYDSKSKSSVALTSYGRIGENPLRTNGDLFFFQKNQIATEFELFLLKLQTPFTVDN